MSRLLLSSVLVALMAGLTLLACIPIEDELLPNIGDEIRITNDPEPNYDPCWYSTIDLNDYWGEKVDLSKAQIAYHDGHTVYLYSFEDKSTVELYSAPAGFEITTLDTGKHRLFIAMHDGAEARIVSRDVINGYVATLYQDNGDVIDSIGGRYYDYDDVNQLLFGRADGNVYYLTITEDRQMKYALYSEGFDVHLENSPDPYLCSFVTEFNGSTLVYTTSFNGLDGSHEKYLVLDNGHYNRYPMNKTCLSNTDGDNDIWDFEDNVQITDKPGEEIELDSTLEYIVFNRVEDGRSDIYVVRK